MTPDELKWVALSLFLDEMRVKLRAPMWGCNWRNDKDYQRFMARVLKPLTKEDL